jgi:hypothetical protein
MYSFCHMGWLYQDNLKSRGFDQETAQIFLPEESDIVQAPGMSESMKFVALSMQSKTDSSSRFGIASAVFFFVCTGCFQAYQENDDLHTVPVTNNPHIIPNHGSSMIPGSGGLTPY